MSFKKFNFLSVCFLFSPFLLVAQFSGTLNYKLTESLANGTDEVNFITYFTAKKSIEFGIPKYKASYTDTVTQTETQGMFKAVRVTNSKRLPFIFKDIAENKMILADNILFKLYLIRDSLNNFRWKITTEHQKISNYNCTKATLNFRGRNYTAWFAEAIPLPLGPWKFGGLPGLIIKVSDSENKFVYELREIDLKAKFDERLVDTPQIYNLDKPLTHKGFIDIYNAKIESYIKMSRVVVTETNGAYGTNSVSLPEKQEKF